MGWKRLLTGDKTLMNTQLKLAKPLWNNLVAKLKQSLARLRLLIYETVAISFPSRSGSTLLWPRQN